MIKILKIFLIVIILVVSLYFFLGQHQQKLLPDIPHIDKILHLIFYAILTKIFISVLSHEHHIKIYYSLFTYGFLVEIMQYFTTHRSFELYDIVANSIGILIVAFLNKKNPG
jgi:VanZ family protein